MTIDEVEKSVYVGGLPYTTTEDSLRKTFSFYGHVIAVKINNEGIGGKCYGFVTFTNPRSAVDAIKDMNGRTIGGRVVRVNEVKAKGGRANTNREGFQHNFERSLSERSRDRDRDYAHYEDRNRAHKRDRSQGHGRDRGRERGIVPENNYDQARDRSQDHGRDRERERGIVPENNYDQARDRSQDQGRDRDREREILLENSYDQARDQSQDHVRDRERGIVPENSYDKAKDQSPHHGRDRDRKRGIVPENNYDQSRDRSLDRDRERNARRSLEENNREQEWKRDNDLDQYRDREVKRSTRHLNSGSDDNDQESNKLNGSHFGEQRTREHSSEPRDSDYEVEEALKDANQYLEELHKQVSQVKALVDEKQLLVSELLAESQNLEDALTAAKKLSSQRQVQLAKLSRCYLQMKNYNEKLKSSEQELQSLVDTTMVDVDDGDDVQPDDNALTYRY